MLITRAKATSLLNQKEMELYNDSRVNALRQLDAKALTTRVGRARDARDRARDLVQRQKLASRDRTGNKRGTSGVANQRSKDKAELLTDILSRFEAQLRQVERANQRAARAAEKQAATAASAKPASKQSGRGRAGEATTGARRASRQETARQDDGDGRKRAGRKASTKQATARTGASATTKASSRAVAGKDNDKSSAAATKAARKSAGSASKPRSSAKTLTPDEALARTHELLEAKQAEARQPKPWETLGQGGGEAGQPGFQSEEAARRAEQLHEAEARIPAIQGSNSTRDRINQGKRDHRRAPGTGA